MLFVLLGLTLLGILFLYAALRNISVSSAVQEWTKR